MSVSSPSKRSRPSKAAKVAAGPEAEKFAPVTDLMSEFCELNDSCFSMLSAALPLALTTKKDERHAFETSVINAFEAACADAETKCKTAIEAAEKEVADHEVVKASSAADLEAAQKTTEQKKASKDAAAGYQEEKQTAHETAEAALKEAQKAFEASQRNVEDQTTAKDTFEKESSEVFPVLKEANYPAKEWRLRNKTISRLSQLLEESSAPESLIAAAKIAFKDKAEARGEFAVATVDATEACLKAHVESCSQGIAEAGSKVEELRIDVAAKDDVAKNSQSELDAAQEAMISADNEWVEADSMVLDLKNVIKHFDQTDKDLAAELAACQASFQRFQDLMGKFQTVRDEGTEGASASAAPAAEEAEA